MSLPAAIPLQSAVDGVQVEEVVEDRGSEYVEAESPSPGIGTVVVLGVVAFLAAGAGLYIRNRWRRQVSEDAGRAVLEQFGELLRDDQMTFDVLERYYDLQRSAAEPIMGPLETLFRDSAIILNNDRRAQRHLGRVGPSALLHDYWRDREDHRRAGAMERAVALAYAPTMNSLGRVARIHARVARGIRIDESSPDWEDVFARTFHLIASAQLMFRHAVSSVKPERQVQSLKGAYEMILPALRSIDLLRSGWARKQGELDDEMPEQATGGREADVTQDIEPGARTDQWGAEQAKVSNALQRIMLISEPADDLERDIGTALRTLRDKDYGPKGGDGRDSSTISFIRGVNSPRPKGDPSGPNSAAFSALYGMPLTLAFPALNQMSPALNLSLSFSWR